MTRIAAQGAEVLERGTPATGMLLGFSLKEIWALIGWAFKMTHSRSAHVEEYLAAMRSKATRPALAINLLVDYDFWLADGPKAGSEQSEQVRFWTQYAAKPPTGIQIETFAGFDPLKHAVQKLGGSTAYFAELTGWASAPPGAPRRIAGFKLYPPMGFSVWGNSNLPDPSPSGGAEIARAKWVSSNGSLQSFGARIDEALRDLFTFATTHDIPLLAHGRDSNELYKGAGKKAHPKYWRQLAENMPPRPERHPLRACLGHYRAEFNQSGDVRKILDLNLAGKSRNLFRCGIRRRDIGAVQGRRAARRN